jgi:hypothetical protein
MSYIRSEGLVNALARRGHLPLQKARVMCKDKEGSREVKKGDPIRIQRSTGSTTSYPLYIFTFLLLLLLLKIAIDKKGWIRWIFGSWS